MDLNHLFQKHQVSLFLSTNAPTDERRKTHQKLARDYGKQIAEVKRTNVENAA